MHQGASAPGGLKKKAVSGRNGHGSASGHASHSSGGAAGNTALEGNWGKGGGGACSTGAVKRKRADSPPTKEKEREVDRNRINKRDMWSYACMSQVSIEDLERQALLEQEQVSNPWEWTRKLIVRPTGALMSPCWPPRLVPCRVGLPSWRAAILDARARGAGSRLPQHRFPRECEGLVVWWRAG